MSEGDLPERVAAERIRRGYFSGRSAARAAEAAGAKISGTTWNDWESGKRPLGDSVRRAVMVLFDWPADWPENPPDDTAATNGGSDDEVSLLRAELEAERAARRSEVQELRDTVEELTDQLGAIAAAVDDLRRGGGAASPRAATE